MKKQPVEFSKRILTAVSIGTTLIAGFSCVMVWRTGDLSPLAYLIPAVFAELAVGTAFYYNKAKAENEIKLQQQYGKENTDENQLEAEIEQP